MSSSSPAPKVPLWVFVVVDVVLIGFASVIAARSPKPWSELTIFTVGACVCAGALLLLVPWLVHVESQKNEMLDDRQRALEALARTVTGAAEQISIAASGLHEIADIAQRNLKHAEQLPHRLQEKIAEFQAQLANANETEREELEKELEELRASESERLESIADKITRTAADLTKLETASHQHLTAANDAVGKLGATTTTAIAKAQAAAEQALGHARQEATRAIGEAESQSLKAIAAAKAAVATDLAAQIDNGIGRLKETTTQLAAMVETLQHAAPTPAPAAATPVEPATVAASTEPAAATAADEPAAPAAVDTPHPVKRPRKRREEPAPAPDTAPVVEDATPVAASPDIAPTVASIEPEPAPFLPDKIAEVVPVAPHTAEPFAAAENAPEIPPDSAPAPEATAATEPVVVAEPPAKSSRKRARKVDDDQPALGLEIDEPTENGDSAPGVVEKVLSSDGATRLVVTAYIGIGNRLFIRGAGPGLSWEKGVPLQFVSIGKWRWETNDATAPVQFKLFKNDEQESASLGALTIDPGHQHEVTANF